MVKKKKPISLFIETSVSRGTTLFHTFSYALIADTGHSLISSCDNGQAPFHPTPKFSGLLRGEFEYHPRLSHTNRQLSERIINSTIPLHRIIFVQDNINTS